MTVDRSYPELLLVGLAIVIAGGFLVAASTSTVAFGAYNPSWEGTSELRSLASESDVQVDVVRETQSYRTADNRTIAFVISPETAYTENESSTLRGFVERGGTVVVAGDFDTQTNSLLAALGVSSRLDGDLLRDEQRFQNAPTLPRATNVSQHNYTADVDALTLNYATALRIPEDNVTRLVRTSPYAYFDTNRNDELDSNETLAHYPVVAVESVGSGRAVIVSDPSVVINSMVDEPGNRQFVENLLGSHERMALDVSHAGSVPPLVWLVLTLRDSLLLQVSVGGLVILGLATGPRILAVFDEGRSRLFDDRDDSPTFSRAELVTSLQERYPGWDEGRVERVAQSLMNREDESQHR